MFIAIEERLLTFFSGFPLIKYKKGSLLMRPEDTPQGVSYLSQGFVRIFFNAKDGDEFTLNIFKQGAFFPLTWAISNIANSYYYEAMNDTQVFRAPKESFLEFIRKDSEILYLINNRLLIGIDSMTLRLEYLMTGDAHCRVANVLLMLSRRFGKIDEGSGDIIIDFNITHKEIAQLAGLSRETVCFEIKKLETNKSIKRFKNTYIICDMEKLDANPLISKSSVSRTMLL